MTLDDAIKEVGVWFATKNSLDTYLERCEYDSKEYYVLKYVQDNWDEYKKEAIKRRARLYAERCDKYAR